MPKKIVIRVHADGKFEIVSKDPDIAVVLILPDGAEAEVLEGDIRAIARRDDDHSPAR